MKGFIHHILLAGLGMILLSACDRKEERFPAEETAGSATAAPLNYHALVIGISEYSGTGWPDLNTADADARAVADVLRSRYGFSVTAMIDEQATRGNILRKLDQLMQLTDQDALLIYFAGHGYYDQPMDEGYWIPYGARRENGGQQAKEDWLWNSSISQILDALPARHVLLIADTCYGGALFRGDEERHEESVRWYRRAMSIPSRYLITSGDLEPVLDSGIRHTVFAQEILNYLQYTDKAVFSASDLAISIRSKVSELTGQLVRMGPLASPAHAGGEFVFVQSSASLPQTALDAEIMQPVGAPELRGPAEKLAAQIETYSQRTPDRSFVRPRVLACLGPDDQEHPEESALIRAKLYESLGKIGGCIIVERESFDDILQEVEFGRSPLADSRAATTIGKLLPASLIIFGELIPLGENTGILLRIVDTESGRVLSSGSATFTDDDELDGTCDQLARRIMITMNAAHPLEFKAVCTEQGMIQANWGKFHGAQIGDSFEVMNRENVGTVSQQDHSLGTAIIRVLGEESCELSPDWNPGMERHSTTNLWLKMLLR
ncbi:MAG: caspase family protein [Pontiellaceae bacterium]|nr:caspase family protein [Pontiellaceae bacterium]